MGDIKGSEIKYEDERKSHTENSHVHDNVEVSGVGHTVNVTKTQSTILPTENSPFEEMVRAFGRWLLGIKKPVSIPILLIPSLASMYIYADWAWWDVIDSIGNPGAYWIRGVVIVWTLVIIALFIMIKRDECPKCKKLLATRTIKREKLKTDKYRGEKIHNIQETYQCDFCKHKFSDMITETE